MVAKSHEDGKEALMCVNVRRPRSSGNSKKGSLNGLTSNNEAIYSAARQVEWTANEGTTRYWIYQDDCGYDLDTRLNDDTWQCRLAADGRWCLPCDNW